MKSINAFVIFLLLINLFSCSDKTDKKAQLESLKKQRMELDNQIKKLEAEMTNSGNMEEKTKFVTVMEVVPQEFNHYIEVQGRIDGDENIAVSAKTPGTITKIFVREGDKVKAGQVLAQMDDDVLRKGLKELNTSLELANNLYEKQKNLWEQKIGSELQFLNAKNAKESLEAKLATLNDQIDMMKIKSPINGTVEEIPVKIGQAVAPGLPAFRVVNFSSIKVVAEVAEAYTAKVEEGNQVVILIPDLNVEFNAKIDFASKYINPVNRTFIVEVRLKPGQIQPRANMLAIIKINDYKANNAKMLPVNLIQSSMDKKFVFITRTVNNRLIAKRQFIKTSNTYNGVAEVSEGLNFGDKVISQGHLDLNDGQAIIIENKE